MESITMNQTNVIARVMAEHPELGYDGWRIEPDDREFAERRRELSEAAAALDLCRRAFRDQRFRKLYKGRQSDYRLKHRVEVWNFDPKPDDFLRGQKYNGIYVCSGVAVATAFLEGFQVIRPAEGRRCLIVVPKPERMPRRSSRKTNREGRVYDRVEMIR
jgi:hypothetical protein